MKPEINEEDCGEDLLDWTLHKTQIIVMNLTVLKEPLNNFINKKKKI